MCKCSRQSGYGFLSFYLRGQRQQKQNMHLVFNIPRGIGGSNGDHKTSCSPFLPWPQPVNMCWFCPLRGTTGRVSNVSEVLKQIRHWKTSSQQDNCSPCQRGKNQTNNEHRSVSITLLHFGCQLQPFNTLLSVSGRNFKKCMWHSLFWFYVLKTTSVTLYILTEGDTRHTTDRQSGLLGQVCRVGTEHVFSMKSKTTRRCASAMDDGYWSFILWDSEGRISIT